MNKNHIHNAMKHAYIILAHNEPELLSILVSLIDDPRNDIFLHVDKKVDVGQFSHIATKWSRLVMLPRIRVEWGGLSQTAVELLAFREAHKLGKYSRYHLLSGVDMPLKTQDYIHHFCDELHPDEEFIGFSRNVIDRPSFKEQYEYLHLFCEYTRIPNVPLRKLLSVISTAFVLCQKCIGYKRKFDLPIRHGANWVSVTDKFVEWLLPQEANLLKAFKYVFETDEKSLHTAFASSPLKSRAFDLNDEMHGCMRAIDWNRGTPYVWKMEDFKYLSTCDRLFARKFSSKHIDIVYALRDWLKKTEDAEKLAGRKRYRSAQ